MQQLARILSAATAMLALGAVGVAAVAQERTISLHNIHTKETISVVYKRDGRYVAAGLEQVNHVMRDWRRDEATKMDPELVDLLWEMHTELGSKEPIHIISGYRSRATNDQLRRTVGGQASESRHILGKAADVHFPDVAIKTLRYSALVREKGGVGYYPTSAIPFVHVDTDRVRSWPRLPRHELALLFPSGSTRHAAADGGAVTRQDAQMAQVRHRDLAQQIAQFHEDRRANLQPGRRMVAKRGSEGTSASLLADAGRAARATSAGGASAASGPTETERAKLAALVAQAGTPAPALVSGPTPAKRPAALASLTGGPLLPPPRSSTPRAEPVKHAALGPGLPADQSSVSTSGAWITAPEWDEEHPEELSYRPFSILPLLHESPHTPLMAELVPHEPARTLDYLDQATMGPLLRFRSGPLAGGVASQRFTGSAIGLAKLDAAKAQAPVPTSPPDKAVKTSQR